MSKIRPFLFLFLMVISGCMPENQPDPDVLKIAVESEMQLGNFTRADSLINLVLENEIPDSLRTFFTFQQERMRRIRLDFRREEAYIKEKLAEYYPDLTEDQLRAWEADKSLEMKIIDGQRRYFNWAHRNLFRVNAEAKKRLAIDANQSDGITAFCLDFVPGMVAALKQNNTTKTRDYKFQITYELTVDSGAVKVGDTLRAWLPFPKSNISRQFDIELLEANQKDFLVAPDNQWHRSVFFEKPVTDPGVQDFFISYTVTTKGEWLGHRLDDIQPYDQNSALYQTYTSERLPHIEFSEPIKSLTDSLVGKTTHPYEIVRKIYTWIDDNFPWASAREYSTIPNIPAYALENKHADCGIHTLLFMTMARYKGIPAKWQSGWILIPGEVGLHDWAEVYFEGLGWVPVDQSFERINSDDEDVQYFYTCGVDPYRLIINDDYSRSFYPPKKYFRSETVDFQRGEVETQDRNLYFNEWSYEMRVKNLE